MATDSLGENDQNNSITLMKKLAQDDGKLVSPIDLSLDLAKPLDLNQLKWINLDNVPAQMKLTNTGDTVIVSAKWANHRPYLTGGPLDGNYVFSQIHFHWGADEHEGSEHTVRGIRYPMEMHVVFFKSRYLTQEAALKYDDGMIIVVYLFKLQNKSTSGLQTLRSQLSKIIQPQTSTMLTPSPLSTLLIPFTKDYLIYWGAISTQNCSHTIMWLVSRHALAVSTEDLDVFRSLLSSKKEPLMKNFRGANPSMGRSVFHVSASENKNHVLLPGCVEPVGQEVIVNCAKVSSLDRSQAAIVFSKGDGSDGEEAGKTLEKRTLKTSTPEKAQHEIDDKRNITKIKKIITKLNKITSVEDSSIDITNKKIAEKLHKIKLEKKDNATTRKLLEKQRKDSLSKPPTPQNVGLSAATMKRLQDRMTGTKYNEKVVCVHPHLRDTEAITATPSSNRVSPPHTGASTRTNNPRMRRAGCL